MKTKRGALLALCEFTREPFASPFSVEWNGDAWDCATNGQAAILLRGATWGERENAPDVGAGVLTTVDGYSGGRTTGGLLEYSFGSGAVCGSCGGAGWIDYAEDGGGGDCGCDDGLPSCEIGSIGDVIFNRRLLYRYLLVGQAYAPSDQHIIRGSDRFSPVLIKSPGLAIAVMPIKPERVSGTVYPLEDIAA